MRHLPATLSPGAAGAGPNAATELRRPGAEHPPSRCAIWRASGTTDTEDLRRAMQHYREVFDRLVVTDGAAAYPTGTGTTRRSVVGQE